MNRENKLDMVIITGIIGSLVLIFFFQAVMFFNFADLFFRIGEQAEPQPIIFQEEFPQEKVSSSVAYQSIFATVTISCENFSSLDKAVLLINGEEVADFHNKQITVKVSHGDLLSIDGSFYVYEIVFKVVAASENVTQPEIGQEIRVSGNIEPVGEVRLK